MTSPYVGEIRLFAGNFAPQDWAYCDGRLLPIDNYSTLFTLIGTSYGGDGVTNFALPNLSSRVPVHQGNGGGTPYLLGMTDGKESVTLTDATMPVHSHTLNTAAGGQVTSPDGALFSSVSSTQDGCLVYGTGTGNLTSLMAQTIQPSGTSQPHDNRQPYLALNFIISLYGEYPPRS